MEHILDLEEQKNSLVELFEKIRTGNTILFLGAGASIGQKKYLSKEIIELYEQSLQKDLNENDITKWIDILSADASFDRKNFDDFVASLLKKFNLTEGHKTLASIPWREIITTNYDLLVEEAYDYISSTHQKSLELKTIRSLNEYNYRESNSEVKYIKLNGCLSDKRKYPFAFSSDDFRNVIKAEGKGILIQEVTKTSGANPDLFFRTKHPIIAEKLVEKFIPNPDKQFKFYEKMLKTIEVGQTNTYLANNLLKTFIREELYNPHQINKLFDAGFTKLSDEPFFLLNYSTNLQTRKDETSLKKAIDLLVYAESLLERRNHRFIHRRGVLNFELAKIYRDKERYSLRDFHLSEAKELFLTKQLMDPFSSYSYADYIKLLIWELNNIEHDKEDELQKRIQIEDLFDLAQKSITDGNEKISRLYSDYTSYIRFISNNLDYYVHLTKMYEDSSMRPYACILLYNHYCNEKNLEKAEKIVSEIEYYQDNNEVIKFLLKYYGQRLYDPNKRIQLLRICRENQFLEKEYPLRYNYFNFIAETYNLHFAEGKGYLSNIQKRFNNLNPEFHFIWSDQDGKELIFEAIIVKNPGEKFKAIKIPSLQQTMKLVKGNYETYKPGQTVNVKLHFYLYGLMAEIIRAN